MLNGLLVLRDLAPLYISTTLLGVQCFTGQKNGTFKVMTNFLIKTRFLFPPRSMIMSNEHILDFQDLHLPGLEARGVVTTYCIQTAGDVILVPESWGHGILNIQEHVALATEINEALWRIRPAPSILGLVPNDNRYCIIGACKV